MAPAFWERMSGGTKAAVLGGAGLGAFFLFRSSQGGPPEALYDPEQPARVSGSDVYNERGGPLPIFLTNASDLGRGNKNRSKGPKPPKVPGTKNDKRKKKITKRIAAVRDTQRHLARRTKTLAGVNRDTPGQTRDDMARRRLIKQIRNNRLPDLRERERQLIKMRHNLTSPSPAATKPPNVGGASL